MVDDDTVRQVLRECRTVVCLGASLNPARPSHYVSGFLIARGYDVWPVNPVHEGRIWHGRPVLPDLASVPVPVDMVDVFRRSEHVPDIVEDALAHLPGLKAIWLQLGIRHDAAANRARQAGLIVVQDRCPKIEWPRLMAG
ncbi:CoA-binding protein [Oceaniovalibus guishaninsula]|nr:CoA-binding protein [Oceaniovalibus guishaninsula]